MKCIIKRTALSFTLIMLFTSLSIEATALVNLQLPPDSVLHRIQQKVEEAFVQAQINKDLSKLNQIQFLLKEKANDKWATYWLGYAYYYEAIYHLTLKNKDKSREVVDMAIDLLKEIKTKDSEDYALLAFLQSFSVQFTSGMQAGVVSSNVQKNAKLAIKMDNQNLRAYYVYGAHDFYTPEEYGGGDEAEEYLKKAIALKDQYKNEEVLPTWGKNLAYEMLIRYYIKKGNTAAAKNYYEQAIALFPSDYQIKQLARKL